MRLVDTLIHQAEYRKGPCGPQMVLPLHLVVMEASTRPFLLLLLHPLKVVNHQTQAMERMVGRLIRGAVEPFSLWPQPLVLLVTTTARLLRSLRPVGQFRH